MGLFFHARTDPVFIPKRHVFFLPGVQQSLEFVRQAGYVEIERFLGFGRWGIEYRGNRFRNLPGFCSRGQFLISQVRNPSDDGYRDDPSGYVARSERDLVGRFGRRGHRLGKRIEGHVLDRLRILRSRISGYGFAHILQCRSHASGESVEIRFLHSRRGGGFRFWSQGNFHELRRLVSSYRFFTHRFLRLSFGRAVLDGFLYGLADFFREVFSECRRFFRHGSVRGFRFGNLGSHGLEEAGKNPIAFFGRFS